MTDTTTPADEREAFEAWLAKPVDAGQDPAPWLDTLAVDAAWQAWQARAAAPQVQQQRPWVVPDDVMQRAMDAAPQVQQEPVALPIGFIAGFQVTPNQQHYDLTLHIQRYSPHKYEPEMGGHIYAAPPAAHLTAEVIDKEIMPLADKYGLENFYDGHNQRGLHGTHSQQARAALRDKLLEFTK